MFGSVDIIGLGVHSSIGTGVPAFVEALRQGTCGIRSQLMSDGAGATSAIFARVGDIDLAKSLCELGLDPQSSLAKRAISIAGRSPMRIKSAVLSCLEAYLDAGLDQELVAPERIALIVGGNNLGQQTMAQSLERLAGDVEMANPRYALQFMDTDHVGTLSAILQIRGEGFTVGGASASGNVAIVKGRQLLLGGHADVCIVVGGLMELSALELAAFGNLGAMGGRRFHDQPERACRPFDRDRDGFVYGQASAALVLARPGVCSSFKPAAAITGASLVLDGNQLSDPSVDGEQRAMSSALAEARIDPGEIGYINAHGTASVIGDQTEVKALREVFGERLRGIRLNSTKSLTGHCLTAAGAIESVASIIQMSRGFLHPNRNLERPIDDGIHFAGAEAEPCSFSACLSNSFGFGGINSSIVIQAVSSAERSKSEDSHGRH